MREIITISEPECCAKPLIYAAVLDDRKHSTIRKHLKKGFEEECMFPVKLKEHEVLEVITELWEDNYSWVRNSYVVEVSDLYETKRRKKK